MRKLLSILLIGILLSACNMPQALPTASPIPPPTGQPPTLPAATATLPDQPAETQTTEATPTSPPAPTLPPVETSTLTTPDGKLRMFLIAEGDNGLSGELIGCNDSLIPVEINPVPGQDPLRTALETLLSLEGQWFGESGLYNALYQSDLQISQTAIDGSGGATIDLTGTFLLGGVCDNPRVQAQLEETVLQFEQIQSVQIRINGTPLAELLSGQ